MLVFKMWKFGLPDAKHPTPNIKFAVPQTQNPNASQWYRGCIVHFIFFVSISFALGSQFPVENGLKDLGVLLTEISVFTKCFSIIIIPVMSLCIFI